VAKKHRQWLYLLLMLYLTKKTMKQIIFFLLCVSNYGFAQTDFSTTVYFAKGKHALTAAANTTLDSLAKALNTQKTPYEIGLTGHASVEASSDYNQKLSERRTDAVAAYLQQHAIASFKTKNAEGETQPAAIGEDEQTLAKSRRVVLNVRFLAKAVVKKQPPKVEMPLPEPTETVGSADSLRWLLAQLMPEKQVFRINNERDTLLLGAKGTQIFVPAYSFDCGKTVEIQLQEAYKRSEMFFTGLATNSPQGLLQSDGMLNIRAFCGSNTTQTIQPAQPITVRMPANKIDDNMNLYASADGKNWHLNANKNDQQLWNNSMGRGSDMGDCGWVGSNFMENYPIFCKQRWFQNPFPSPIMEPFNDNKNCSICRTYGRAVKLPKKPSAQIQRAAKARQKLLAEAEKVEKIVRKYDKMWNRTSIFKRRYSGLEGSMRCEVYRLGNKITQQQLALMDSLAATDPTYLARLDQKQVEFYAFKSANLGWKNIDALYHNSTPVQLTVKEPYNPGKSVQILFKNAQSLMPLTQQTIYYGMAAAPKPQPITIVGLQYKNGAPYLALQDGNTKEQNLPKLEYQRLASLDELKNALKKLD
jgi:OmpA family